MFTDIMVDLETTGSNPEYNNMIQIAAVKFNLDKREVSPDKFDMALSPAPNRFWDEGTKLWWGKMPEIYKSIMERAQDPAFVMHQFCTWVGKDQPPAGYRLWAKPITFEWAFLSSYCRQFGLEIPFHYRYARDLNSYLAGLHSSPEHVKLEEEVPFEGKEHDAIWDVFHQIKVLFHAQDKMGIVQA